ncbi:MAG: hypothetical protein K9W42_08640 [Candidatus Heimdallarchaeota archaeon]|nr:hypothetical protein [Candidatus Heimdallarchaeota archaeon]
MRSTHLFSFTILILLGGNFGWLPIAYGGSIVQRNFLSVNSIESHFITSFGCTITPENKLIAIYNEFKDGLNKLKLLTSTSDFEWKAEPELLFSSNISFSVYGEPSAFLLNETYWVVVLFRAGGDKGFLILTKNNTDGSSWQQFYNYNSSTFTITDIVMKPFQGKDAIALAWKDNHLGSFNLYSRFYNLSTKDWSPIFNLTIENSYNCYDADFFIDTNNTVHYVWAENCSNFEQIQYCSIFINGTQSSTEILTNGDTSCREPTIVGQVDKLFVFWTNHTVENPGADLGTINIQMSEKKIGQPWSTAEQIAPYSSIDQTSSFSDAKSPSVAIDAFGKLWLAYEVREVYYNHMGIELRGRDIIFGWQKSEHVSLANNPAIKPQIIADTIGNVHCFWLDFRNGNYQLFYRIRFLDNTWSDEISLTKFTFTSSQVTIYVLLILGALTLILLPTVILYKIHSRKTKKLLQKKIDSLQD